MSDPFEATPRGNLRQRFSASALRLFFTFRFQFIGALVLGVALPLLVRSAVTSTGLFFGNHPGTVVGLTIAVILGHFFLRHLMVFPGAETHFRVIWVFTASFLVVILSFFLFRFEYTRSTLVMGYVFCITWFLFIGIVTRRLKPMRLAVVPGGAVEELTQIQKVTWVLLKDPPQQISREWNGIVVDLRADLSDSWARLIADAALAGIPVFHVKQIREALTGRVEIERLSENMLGSLIPNQGYLEIKQTLDWILAFVILILFSPLFLVISILIKLDSSGPVLFKQRRRGFRGETFTVYKFRTMVTGSERPARTAEGAPKSELSRGPRERAMTQDRDSRITRVGRFLRRSRLDELPQIINILRVEMSWVGPRPEALVLSEWYEAELPFYSYRHIVHPGITGWAQVNQGHVTDLDDVTEKLHYDFYYIKNFSLWLDLLIVAMTIKVVLAGSGAR